MRPTGKTTAITFGFILAIGITLILPHFAFGASRSFGGSGRFRAARVQRQPSFLRPFHGFDSSGRFRTPGFDHRFQGFGFVGVGGVIDDQPIIIIQQFQPAPAAERREPATDKVYVQPRWVDGGYGVEVLQPGYWTDPKHATER